MQKIFNYLKAQENPLILQVLLAFFLYFCRWFCRATSALRPAKIIRPSVKINGYHSCIIKIDQLSAGAYLVSVARLLRLRAEAMARIRTITPNLKHFALGAACMA